MYGQWPGVNDEQLNEGRDLKVTTDFRNVLGEAAYKTLGATQAGCGVSGSAGGAGKLFEFCLEMCA